MIRAIPLPACPQACTCPECSELGFAFPGEARQLAIPLPSQPLPQRRRLAEIEAEAFRKVHWS